MNGRGNIKIIDKTITGIVFKFKAIKVKHGNNVLVVTPLKT